MSYPVFTALKLYNIARGGTLITWTLHPLFRPAGVYTFTVQASRSGVGDWSTVATVQDTYLAEDPNRWQYGTANRLHYRVVLEAGGVSYESQVMQTGYGLSQRDGAMLGEIVRKEQARFRLTGMCGYLYKRRHWGQPCTSCLDFDTGEVTNSSCAVCLGTGFIGGYFQPVEYWVSKSSQGPQRRRTTDADARGLVEDSSITVRGLNCPWLDTGDVWVDFASDRRYVVQTVVELDYRGVVFVFDPIELRLAPSTDVIYTLVRPDVPASSSLVAP